MDPVEAQFEYNSNIIRNQFEFPNSRNNNYLTLTSPTQYRGRRRVALAVLPPPGPPPALDPPQYSLHHPGRFQLHPSRGSVWLIPGSSRSVLAIFYSSFTNVQ